MITPLDFLADLFNPSLAFLPRALAAVLLASVVTGVVGCHVMMRGMVFIGDAVAHSVFPGLAVAFVLGGNLMVGGLTAGVVTAILVAIFSQNQRLREDSVIGIFFAASFALGIVIISLAPGYSGSVQDFLFGSIVGVSNEDITNAAIMGAVILLVLWLFHRQIVTVSLDRHNLAVEQPQHQQNNGTHNRRLGNVLIRNTHNRAEQEILYRPRIARRQRNNHNTQRKRRGKENTNDGILA